MLKRKLPWIFYVPPTCKCESYVGLCRQCGKGACGFSPILPKLASAVLACWLELATVKLQETGILLLSLFWRKRKKKPKITVNRNETVDSFERNSQMLSPPRSSSKKQSVSPFLSLLKNDPCHSWTDGILFIDAKTTNARLKSCESCLFSKPGTKPSVKDAKDLSFHYWQVTSARSIS